MVTLKLLDGVWQFVFTANLYDWQGEEADLRRQLTEAQRILATLKAIRDSENIIAHPALQALVDPS